MKKKGILLLGSLSLMVVAMVFIAVTLVSRASVTPEESDAATLKKKGLTVSSSLSKSTNTLPLKYRFQKLEQDETNVVMSFADDMNQNGYIVGLKDVVNGRVTIWDPKGNTTQITDPQFKDIVHTTKINNSNVIIGINIDISIDKMTSFKYIPNKGYQELKGIPQEKTETIKRINSQYLKSLETRNPFSTNSNLSNEYNSYVNQFANDYTEAKDLNNDGDVVGTSNGRAMLWINEKLNPIDLSLILLKHYPNTTKGYAMVISDRVNGEIQILGAISDSSGDNAKDLLFILNYSVLTQKEVSFQLIENIANKINPRPWPTQILNDRTIAMDNYFNDQYGFEKSDSYFITEKGDYKNYVDVTSFFQKANIEYFTVQHDSVNNNKIAVGGYLKVIRGDDYYFFILDLNTGQIQLMENMIKEGQIIDYVPGTKFYPKFINDKGEILVRYQNQELISSLGWLIPVK